MKTTATILLLMTIATSCQRSDCDQAKYLHGVPPAPPYRETMLELPPIETGIESGCYSIDSIIIGYVIEYPLEDDNYVLIQDINGVRAKYYYPDEIPNYILTSLPYVLIPGNKLEITAVGCGNGGYKYLQSIKSLRRSY